MTRFLNLVATEPEVSVLPIMVDSSRFSVLEAGLKCVQGKGVANSLSLKEGEEPFLDQARRVRRLGAAALVDGIRRAGSGRDGRAQGRRLRARVRAAYRARRLRAAGHHLRPEHPRRRHRDRGARRVRQGVHRRDAPDQGALPRRPRVGRDLEPLLRLSRRRPRARGDPLRVPLPRHPGGARHGHRQRGPAGRVRGHRAGAARARRGSDLQPAPRRDRAPARVRAARGGRRDEARGRSVVAGGARREAAGTRARARDRRLHRG